MKHILEKIDHTLLKPTCNLNDIKKLCDEAKEMGVASVCIPPTFVNEAYIYLKGSVPICTVIGFPLGYNTTAVKVFEAKNAVQNGATEIDMVINITDVKSGNFDKIEQEIIQIKDAIGNNILKVIIENCYLTNEEKQKLCQIVSRAKADFIKTSTGFGTGGANIEDIKLMKENVSKNVKIKAAGGVRSIEDAEKFIEEGATRLGTSSICQIIKDEEVTGY